MQRPWKIYEYKRINSLALSLFLLQNSFSLVICLFLSLYHARMLFLQHNNGLRKRERIQSWNRFPFILILLNIIFLIIFFFVLWEITKCKHENIKIVYNHSTMCGVGLNSSALILKVSFYDSTEKKILNYKYIMK